MDVQIEDADAATSRSSAKRIATIVSKFDDLKKKMVIDIGFGGMLHMPQNNKVCRKFFVWLLSRIDVSKREIFVNDDVSIPIFDRDIKKLLHIPCGPMKLIGLGKEIHEKIDFIKFAIGSVATDVNETSSLKVAEDILSKEYPNGMTIEEENRFKVSFVVFVTGHFLIARTKINHGSEDYWGSLLDTTKIDQFNYCEFVIDELMESATRVQAELKAGRTIKHVSGCSLGLQVHYIENFNLGILGDLPLKIPRISLYDCETMSKMVRALKARFRQTSNDKPHSSGNTEPRTVVKLVAACSEQLPLSVCNSGHSSATSLKTSSTGKGNVHVDIIPYKITKTAVSSYLDAYMRDFGEKKLTYKQVDDLKWHNARMTLHVRKTKSLMLEGVGHDCSFRNNNSMVEVHMESHMAKIFQDNLTLAQRLHEHQDSKDPVQTYSNIKLQRSDYSTASGTGSFAPSNSDLNAAFVDGSAASRKFGLTNQTASGGSCASTGAHDWLSPIHGKRLFNDNIESSKKRIKQESIPANSGTVHNSDSKTQSKSNQSTSSLPADIIDMDIYGFTRNLKKIKCNQGNMAGSPWLFGAKKSVIPQSLATNLYNWLVNSNDGSLQRNWIMHSTPRYIELNGLDLKDIFVKNLPFTRDAMDICIRRFNQIDRTMYGEGNRICWRMSLESDFADVVTSSEDPLLQVSVLQQFINSSEFFDPSKCRMIIIPAFLEITWCCYFWDMKEHTVHIIDPSYDPENVADFDGIHKQLVAKLQLALSLCINKLFDGWSIDWASFKNSYVMPLMFRPQGSATGILTLVSIQQFDGTGFVTKHTEESLKNFEHMVLYEMMSIEDNYGRLPSSFIHTLDR